MKDIRIFIASSKELNQERNELAFVVLAKEEEFAQRGLRVRLSKWEYVDPKMTAGRTEDRYLDEMYNCDAAMVIFKNIAGMYTREELDKALAREADGSDRIKTHKILFSAESKPDSDAAKLRGSLPEEKYGVYANLEELKTVFLELVDEVAESDRLVDVEDESLHEVSAFIAADDELASDRNAFADTILNLNDILARRGIRVRMRFYDPEHHRELLESSEMALVLYNTNYKAFGPEQMHDAYERTKREENPKRLYVFFRDEDESMLDRAFVEFRNGFAENLGHFFCRFENTDTLKLNFILSLENALGDGVSFVKLDGKKIKADEFEVAEITRLPMVANNEHLSGLIARVDALDVKFDELSEACKKDPNNEELYRNLLLISTKKNELESQVNKELAQSFDLAKRMAAISAKEANATITKARALLDQGHTDEALKLLDGASSSLDDLLGALEPTEDILTAVAAEIDVQTFRASTVMTYGRDPFQDRFAKAESIYKSLLAKVGQKLMEYRKGQARLVKLLVDFGNLYDRIGDTKSKAPLFDKALKLYRSHDALEPDSHRVEIANILLELARCHKLCNQFDIAEMEYTECIGKWCSLQKEVPYKFEGKLADAYSGLGDLKKSRDCLDEAEKLYQQALVLRRAICHNGSAIAKNDVACSLCDLASLHKTVDKLNNAEQEYQEALSIVRELTDLYPTEYRLSLANALSGLGDLYETTDKLDSADKMYEEALSIRRKLAESNPAMYDSHVACSLMDLAGLYDTLGEQEKAEMHFSEALKIRRRLAMVNPSQFESAVATSLAMRGGLYARSRSFDKAETDWNEALSIRKKLMQVSPDRFMGSVAASVLLLAKLHHYAKNFSRANTEYAEAVSLYRKLAEKNPEKYLRSVAGALKRYGTLKQWMNDFSEAETLIKERLEIYAALVKIAPTRYESCLADALGELANLYDILNRQEEADLEFSHAVEIMRKLANANPKKYRSNLGWLLSDYGCLKMQLNELIVAEEYITEALQIEREGGSTDGICRELLRLADLHKTMNNYKAAESEYAESLTVARELANRFPNAYCDWVANILSSYGDLKLDMNLLEKAEEFYSEALEIRQKLRRNSPDMFDEDVAVSFHDLAILHTLQNKLDAASTEFAEALQIREKLAAENPNKFNEELAATLHEQAKLLIKQGNASGAKTNLERASEMRKALVAINAEKFTKALEKTNALLASIANC